MKKRNYPEYTLQAQICQWLSVQHPDVLFQSDTVASVRLSAPQAIRNTRIQKRGFKSPDLALYEPKGTYSGLFIELKTESPFKKDGNLKKCPHLEGQQKSINDLRRKGYYACFSWGFEQTKQLIENYLNQK